MSVQMEIIRHIGWAPFYEPRLRMMKKHLRGDRLQCKGTGKSSGSNGQQPDYTRLFQDSQNNIMRLNQSRLNALAELKSARQRIADLEKRLGEATEQIQAVSQQQSQAEAHDEYYSYAEQDPYDSVYEDSNNEMAPPHQRGHQQQQQQQQQSITLAYSTGWKRVFIHYKSQSQDWTEIPGIQLHPGSGNLAGHHVVILPTSQKVEFVMNNGEGSWDSPNYSSGSKNYIIPGPGNYFLKSGKVQKAG